MVRTIPPIVLKRKAYGKLLEWKDRKHKCLLVSGQRQVGKTYIIDRFGKENYEHYAYFDFNEIKELKLVFGGNLDVDSIIAGLSLYADNVEFVPGSTLIVLDEIQECPEARASLKYFTIDGRYDVIASGSMLGVKIPRKKSDSGEEPMVPVGYEEHLNMCSLDFEEFLWANGISERTINDARASIHDRKPVTDAVLNRFSALFKDYMIVGGMPEAVDTFLTNHNFVEAGRVLGDLIKSCKKDINRYTEGADRIKTIECFESIPIQLAESNKKFMYSRINGGESRNTREKYGENLMWIKNAGYGNYCDALTTLALPLENNEMKHQFRVYMSDTGLLMHMYGRDAMKAIYSEDYSYNVGAIAENVVAECLVKSGYNPRFYKKNGGPDMMELDFVTTLGSEIAVIEVKSGKKRTAPSLGKVDRFYKVGRRIIFERSNIYVDESGIEHYPLFASAFFDELEPEWDGPEF